METVFFAIMDQLGQRSDSVRTTEGLVRWRSLISRGLLRWNLRVCLWRMMSAVLAFLKVFRGILWHQVLSYLWLLTASDLPCCWYFRLANLG